MASREILEQLVCFPWAWLPCSQLPKQTEWVWFRQKDLCPLLTSLVMNYFPIHCVNCKRFPRGHFSGSIHYTMISLFRLEPSLVGLLSAADNESVLIPDPAKRTDSLWPSTLKRIPPVTVTVMEYVVFFMLELSFLIPYNHTWLEISVLNVLVYIWCIFIFVCTWLFSFHVFSQETMIRRWSASLLNHQHFGQ